jgi:hypothetical protein
VAVGLPPVLSVVAEQDDDPRVSRGQGIAAVVYHDSPDRFAAAKVDLPPGFLLVGGVKSPPGVLDAVDPVPPEYCVRFDAEGVTFLVESKPSR